MPYGMGIKHLYGTRYILFVVGTFCVVFMFGTRSRTSFYTYVFHHDEGARGSQERSIDDAHETGYR